MTGRTITLMAAGALLGACQTAGVPAVLERADAASMDGLKAALARATGQAQVQLGPGDPTQSPEISVLPRPPGPPDDRSLAMPTLFRLEIAGGACFVVRKDDSTRTPVEGVACRPA
jgi:hypothetical protein